MVCKIYSFSLWLSCQEDLAYNYQNWIIVFVPLRESHGTGGEGYYLVCSWILMNSILYTVGHFLMQIAISQELPLESIIIILTARCLPVTYNAAPYIFVLAIFQRISGVVLIFYKKVNNHYL